MLREVWDDGLVQIAPRSSRNGVFFHQNFPSRVSSRVGSVTLK